MSNTSYFQSRAGVFTELGFRENALPKLQAYVDLLWSANEDLNLISRKMTYPELIDNHVIDCLLPLKHFPSHVKIAADFGTGGGLPGLIYAIQFPHIQFQLFEKSIKKQEFLKSCSAVTKNIVICGDIPSQLKDIDLVIARGFKPLDTILEMSRSYCNDRGKYFLLKARAEKIEEEIVDSQKKFKTLKIEKIPLKSPVLEVERHLILIN